MDKLSLKDSKTIIANMKYRQEDPGLTRVRTAPYDYSKNLPHKGSSTPAGYPVNGSDLGEVGGSKGYSSI